MSKDVTSRRNFLKLAGAATGTGLFGAGTSLSLAAVAPRFRGQTSPPLETGPADYILHIASSPVEIAPNTSSRQLLTTVSSQAP